LGQLLQGRWLLAGFMFIMTALLWMILLGWIIHLWSVVDAAVYRSDRDRYRDDYRYKRNRDRYEYYRDDYYRRT